jgi:cob(I)alamin adenosyltransferase
MSGGNPERAGSREGRYRVLTPEGNTGRLPAQGRVAEGRRPLAPPRPGPDRRRGKHVAPCYLKVSGEAKPEGNGMKIYTRAGDNGETGLYGGTRVRKDIPRVDTYGTLDELNAVLGLAVAGLGDGMQDVRRLLLGIQSELFDLGAELATPVESRLASRVPQTTPAQVTALEEAIDRCQADLPPLKTFILPGGVPAAAYLHLARTVARRAERRVVSLAGTEAVNGEILRYLNRLSDLLFVLARVANASAGVQDIPWQHGAAELA